MSSPLGHADVEAILCQARLAQVAVETASGPHVTPAAYGVADGRLWLVVSRGTIKVKAIRRRPVASLLVRDGARSLVLAGRAEVISGWGRDDVGNLIANYLPSLFAVASYAERNSELLSGTIFDMLGSPSQTNPYDRVMVAVRPQRGLVLDGASVTRAWGRWGRLPRPPRTVRPKRGANLAPLLARVPKAAAAAVEDGGEAALGWLCPSGPVALPASPLLHGVRVEVPDQALQAVGATPRADACLTLDRTRGSRPSRFAGVILRGKGAVAGHRSGWATVALQTERVSWWVGFRSGTAGRGGRSS